MIRDEDILTIREWIYHAKRAVFFGGAGVSTESGVPDFRSKDGLYNQHDVHFEGYSPEYLLSHDCLVREPEVFFEFYRQKMDTRFIKPNAAHLALAKWEREGNLYAVVTQNIDGLHQKAGSKRVFELHGSTGRNYCSRCMKRYASDYIFTDPSPVPHCACGGIVRCDVTLYGEALPEEEVSGAVEALSRADLLIVGGTSLSVYPAASFLHYFSGEHILVVNRDPLHFPLRPGQDLEINASIGELFEKI